MRFLVGERDGKRSVYAVDGERAVELTGRNGVGDDLQSLIELGPPGVAAARAALESGEGVSMASIAPSLPIERPTKVLCLGLNYVDHVKEGGYEIPTYPAMFVRFPTSLVPAGAPMIRPLVSERFDYETELMLVIGKGGRHISEAAALDHVFGYTTFNDGSVRDYQRKTHQWTPGKNFDGTGAIGPVVVTPDELPPGAKGLKIESRLNGEVMQSANTDDMMWPVAKIITTVSEFLTLEAGDLIATGTPPGVGHARRPPVFMKHGDTIEVEIEGIGICRNPIVDEVTEASEMAS